MWHTINRQVHQLLLRLAWGTQAGNRKQSSEVCKHFAHCGYESFSLQIIECVKEGGDLALIQLKGVWQNRLAKFYVHGNVNIRDFCYVFIYFLFFPAYYDTIQYSYKQR